MSLRVLCRGLLAVAVLAVLAGRRVRHQAPAPWGALLTPRSRRTGRIYVFAIGQRYDTFQKSGGTEVGQAITRPGYGPTGETGPCSTARARSTSTTSTHEAGAGRRTSRRPEVIAALAPYPSGISTRVAHVFGELLTPNDALATRNTIQPPLNHAAPVSRDSRASGSAHLTSTYDLTFHARCSLTTVPAPRRTATGSSWSPGNINHLHTRTRTMTVDVRNKQVGELLGTPAPA
jgi:hypothetical protein